jgi:hypothetical protein
VSAFGGFFAAIGLLLIQEALQQKRKNDRSRANFLSAISGAHCHETRTR